MVAGKILVHQGVVLTTAEATVRTMAKEQAQALAHRVAADPVHQSMALLKPMARGYLQELLSETAIICYTCRMQYSYAQTSHRQVKVTDLFFPFFSLESKCEAVEAYLEQYVVDLRPLFSKLGDEVLIE